MRKKFSFILISIIISIVTMSCAISLVLANDDGISGEGGPGYGTVGGGGGEGGWNSKFGFFISVYDKDNKLRGYIRVNVNKEYTAGVNITINNWIYKENDWKVDPTKLYEYLDIPYGEVSGDYQKLKEYLNLKKLTLNTGDYVLIEPFTHIDGNLYTFRGIVNNTNETDFDLKNKDGEIIGKAKFYQWYETPARILATAAKVGSNITVGGNTYIATNGTCSDYGSGNWCGYKNNKYIGYGITVVSYDQIYQSTNVKLTIKKTDASTGTPMSNVGFTLTGNGQTLTEKTDANGKLEFNVPSSSTVYTLTETVPTNLGYSSSSVSCNGCETINNNVMTVLVQSDKTIYITNAKDCSLDLARYTNPTVSQLMELYDIYGAKGLLNFSNPSCSTNITTNYNTQDGCLYADMSISNFNANNLSGYETKYELNNSYTAFCGHTFKFTNIYNTTGPKNFGTYKAGQLVVNLDSTNGKIGDGQIIETCYVFGNANQFLANENLNNYLSYIGDVSFADKNLISSISESSNNPQRNTTSDYTVVSLTYNSQYSVAPIYLYNISGEVADNEFCSNCKFLSYGIISKLNSTTGAKNLEFKVLNSNNEIIIENNNSCSYNIFKELLTEGNELNLEFRTIKSSNAFPGKDGDGRIVGSNWCNGSDCNSSNDLISNIMNNRNDSYNKLNSQPLYRIVLTPDTIKSIREYNKNNPYDDYTLQCDTNNKCKSKFLEDYGFLKTAEEIQWLKDYKEIVISNDELLDDSITE